MNPTFESRIQGFVGLGFRIQDSRIHRIQARIQGRIQVGFTLGFIGFTLGFIGFTLGFIGFIESELHRYK